MDKNLKKRGLIIMGCIAGLILIIVLANVIENISNQTNIKLGQYTGLDVDVKEVTVTDADVENALIEDVTAEQENVDISNRLVRNGDIANIDYTGKVDGVAFDGGTDTGYDLEIGSDSFIDGFEDQIIGMGVGQTSDIKVTFPDNYTNTDLAGAEAVFTVKVNSISGKVIPTEITDDMIKEISDTYTTVTDYRKYVREELEKEAEETNKQNKYDAVWKIVAQNATVNSLSSKKTSYYSELYESNYQSYADTYSVSLSELITSYMGITVEEFNSNKKSYAEEMATKYGIAETIANENGISINDDEYQAYLDKNNISSDETEQYGEATKDEALYQKVVEFVASKTKFTVISE